MSEKSKELVGLLRRGVDEKIFSGAQAAWFNDGEWGQAEAGQLWEGGPMVCAKSLFDIASLTKVYTSTVLLRLVDRGVISLNSKLGDLLGRCESETFAHVSLEEILAHEGGFPSWEPFFEELPLNHRGTSLGRRLVFEKALRVSRSPSRAAEYSDLGFIALTACLERVRGKSLDALVAEEITNEFALSPCQFLPLMSPVFGKLPSYLMGIAATELCPWRGRRLIGEVHDDNAWSMGGISGHAGMFANARAVAEFGKLWLDALSADGIVGSIIGKKAILRRSSGRGLGWDLKSSQGSSAGSLLSPLSFGHLGYTGCSLWIDPYRSIVIALLTNRVYYGRKDTRIRIFRPKFHDSLVGSAE